MTNVLNTNVLVLNKMWQPIHTCSARRAVKLLCQGHAQVVEAEGEMKYQTHDFGSWLEASAEKVTKNMIRSVNFVMEVPKVIVLAIYDKLPMKDLKYSRDNVYLRDDYTCQYCSKTLPARQLNLDHVIPRDKGGGTSWDNIVTSCFPCNNRKANMLPHEAKMFPANAPRAPRWQPYLAVRKRDSSDDCWQSFLGEKAS
ncbi:MAG: HNH endonuclease [Akkermansiaceae bacterium]